MNKILFIILFLFITVNNATAESLQDLENELNDIKNELSKLSDETPINPILPVVTSNGKPLTAVVLSEADSNGVVTYMPLGQLNAKPQTGILLGNSNVKDILTIQSAEREALAASEKINAQISIDKAITEVDEATKFMQNSYKNGDIDGAIAALAVIDVAISDVSKNLPQ